MMNTAFHVKLVAGCFYTALHDYSLLAG